jgi:hypothetical protein
MNKHNIIKKGTIYKISSDKTDMIYIGCTSNDIKNVSVSINHTLKYGRMEMPDTKRV